MNSVDLDGFEGQFFIIVSPESSRSQEGWEEVSNSEIHFHTTIGKHDFKKMRKLEKELELKKQKKLNDDLKAVDDTTCVTSESETQSDTNETLKFQEIDKNEDSIRRFTEKTNFKKGNVHSSSEKGRVSSCQPSSKLTVYQNCESEKSASFLIDSAPVEAHISSRMNCDEEPDNKDRKLGTFLIEAHPLPCFTCQKCGKKCNTQGNLTVHMETHGDKLRYRCEECEKCFKQKAGLIQHMYTHKAKMYSCEFCSKNFVNAANLSRHRKKHLKDPGTDREFFFKKKRAGKKEKKKHSCSICQKVLSRKSLLTYHMNVHNKLRPYKCNQCPSAFAARTNLLKHKSLHQK